MPYRQPPRMASSTTTPAEYNSQQTDRRGRPGAGAARVASQSLLLARHRPGDLGQTGRAVHLVPVGPRCDTGVVAALCGGLLCLEEIETVEPGEGVPCHVCLMNQATAMTCHPESSGAGFEDPASSLGEPAYQAWGWPVRQHRGVIQLRLDCDASAIAIPTVLSVQVTQVLVDRLCAPAVLAHPDAPDHHMVLAGERFGTTLPWPSGVYQVTGAVMLPPTKTIYGPITWVHPPSKDSLRLSREIDIFSALRTVFND